MHDARTRREFEMVAMDMHGTWFVGMDKIMRPIK